MAAPDVDFVTLTGVIGAMVGDTDADPDKDPDFVPATEGTITLTPAVASVHVTDSVSGKTIAMVPFPIVATIDAQGRLAFNGDTQVTLVDLGSSKVNPQVPRNKAAYNVTFSGVKMDSATVKLAGFGINPSPEDVGGDGTINLFDLQPLPVSPGGAAIARGMGVPPVTTAALGDVVTYDGTDIKWAPSSGTTDASDLTSGTLAEARLPDLSGTYAPSALQSLQPPALNDLAVTITANGSDDPRFCDYFDGYMWGTDATDGTISRSDDEGVTWTAYCDSINATAVNKFLLRLMPTSDGEVIALYSDGVYKSSGWASGNSATWTKKVSSNTAHCSFLTGGFDGDGTKFVVSEYADPQANWADSRYAYISVDSGDTWTAAYDSVAVIGTDATALSHLHSCCYDSFADRFYVSEGHNAGGGLWCSTDDGATWTRADGMGQNLPSLTNGPTVVIATPAGLVCGSDNYQNGLFGVVRRDDIADEVLTPTWNLQTGRDGLIAFAQRGWYDVTTGLVYVTFRAEFDDTPLVIAAGTPYNGGLVYKYPVLPTVGGADKFVAIFKPSTHRLVAYMQSNSLIYTLRATIGVPGAHASSAVDTSNITGGTTTTHDSVSVGAGSASTNIRGLVSGPLASASGSDAVVLGYKGSATTTGGIAIGSGATVTHQRSVALGKDVATTSPDQVKIAAKHVEIDPITLPAIPPAGSAQLVLIDDGTATSKGQLVVQFRTGTRRILATQNGCRTVGVDTAHAFTDDVLIVNSTVTRTITLLSAAGRNGCRVTVKNVGTTAATIASTAGTIDGATTATLAQWAHATYISDGTNWLTIG